MTKATSARMTPYDFHTSVLLPKKYPMLMNMSDQIHEERSMRDANTPRWTRPRAAGIGTNTLIAGRSFPIKRNQRPFFLNTISTLLISAFRNMPNFST
ncbi:MAG: hypothetical protein A2845_00505 [Candidatus Lloydbacteria bacterium RIFCSPHIGHO2_01_FULL_49_22]|uniref:Uncharacterized protein n=1 Tax=Candidatus Lloydbacteria bacterium RIFCSPHIGHO2_01_FULL_49_22 TaxID=1798658 RepID=A0A1G2CY13_9BACT|nr:MAG: hypothetical protein A2845_00505 [Candidatus Lloydbacteria bacterium RIFCSPHIGHO2_01_FULL_49_22]